MNLEILLAAIAIVETNGKDFAVGAAGERSRYQIMEYVWYEHSEKRFEIHAQSHKQAKAVALKHIQECIIPQLHRAKVNPNVLTVSACWNAGVHGYLKHLKGVEYANKVEAQYNKLYNETTH